MNLNKRIRNFLSLDLKIKTKSFLLLGLCVTCALVILPILVANAFNRPSADDFEYAASNYHLVKSGKANPVSLVTNSINDSLKRMEVWQGLYMSGFLLALEPGIFGGKYYGYGSLILLIFIFSASFFCFVALLELITAKKPLKTGLRRKLAALYAGLFTALFVTAAPNLVEGLFWFNGAWNYTAFLAAMLVEVGLIAKLSTPKNQIKRFRRGLFVAGISVLAFLIAGGNHVISFLNILFLTVPIVLAFKKNWPLLLPLACAIFGFTIVMLAPGTALRAQALPHAGLMETLAQGLIGPWKMFAKFFFNVSFIFWLVALFALAQYLFKNKNTQSLNQQSAPHPILIAAISFALYAGMFCVPYMAMRSFGDGRVINMYWCYFYLRAGGLLVYSYWYFRPRWQISLPEKINPAMIVVFLAILMASFGLHESHNVQASLDLVSGAAYQYAKTYDAREAKVEAYQKQNPHNEVLVLEALPQNKTLFFDDIKRDLKHWQNESFYRYYQIKAVLK